MNEHSLCDTSVKALELLAVIICNTEEVTCGLFTLAGIHVIQIYPPFNLPATVKKNNFYLSLKEHFLVVNYIILFNPLFVRYCMYSNNIYALFFQTFFL